MIYSMTGFGAAGRQQGALEVRVEIRSVNGRFLKVTVKAPSQLNPRISDLERLCKEHLARGSVMLAVFLQRRDPESLVSVDEDVVKAYQTIFGRLGIPLEPLATLPGVLAQGPAEELSEEEWQLVATTVTEALDKLVEMRRVEGEGLARAVAVIVHNMESSEAAARERAPAVVQEYSTRLAARLNTLLAESEASVDGDALAREVAVFADRSDITEELDRLCMHLEHLNNVMEEGGAVGRKLDFIAQEMLREVNTVGSKSADAELGRLVVDLKSDVERVKEQVANIE